MYWIFIICPGNTAVKETDKNSESWTSHFSSEGSTGKKYICTHICTLYIHIHVCTHQVVESSINKMTYHPSHKNRVLLSIFRGRQNIKIW